MTSCRSVVVLAVMFLSALMAFVGCTTKVDYTMGSEFVPTNQNMELRRRVYELGGVREGSNESDCSLFSTRLYKSDSIVSSNVALGFFGMEKSDTYGVRRAGFLSQMVFSLSLPEGRGWGYRPIFDSMQLSLYVMDYHGDTTRTHRYAVYEITSNDYLEKSANRNGRKDTTFYINFDPTPYISTAPIFEFSFPNPDKGVYVGDVDNPKNCEVRLEETPATEEYIRRLMLMTDLEDNGGYALDSDNIYVSGNEDKFVDAVRGIYIAPVEDSFDGEGAMFATDLENTALLLYARGRYEEDPTIIRDTTYMIYNLFLDTNQYDISAGNVSINTVEHDYAGTNISVDVSEGMDVSTCYVEGMGGVVTEVSFTDECIQSLADIVLDAGDATVSVNQALVHIYLDGVYPAGSEYDYLQLDPVTLTPLMDDAMVRMGMYVDYEDRIAIPDYSYAVETQYTLSYDGYLNRSLACYTMDVSTYVQTLMLEAARSANEDGVVDFARFREDYDEGSSLVTLRRFYLGPEAYSMFDFRRQSVEGMAVDAVGSVKAAPMKLELTYTVIN